MKLFLISQDENDGYDTYDSAVVVAENEDEARRMHPGYPHIYWSDEHGAFGPSRRFGGFTPDDMWAPHPDDVSVVLIGEAGPDVQKPDVICASFNAG